MLLLLLLSFYIPKVRAHAYTRTHTHAQWSSVQRNCAKVVLAEVKPMDEQVFRPRSDVNTVFLSDSWRNSYHTGTTTCRGRKACGRKEEEEEEEHEEEGESDIRKFGKPPPAFIYNELK